MKLKNGIDIEIRKTWYNKVNRQKDNIICKVDTDKQYTAYQFRISKKLL